MASITLDQVRVVLGDRTVLQDVDLAIADGEVVALLGASGSGKTTLLRAVAGLVPLAAGRVLLDGEDATSAPTAERGLGMVSQTSTLLPTTDVAGNIAFPMQVRGEERPSRRRRTLAEARAFGLEHLLRRRPKQLSTGQRHAASTARAMVVPRAGLLLDEPVVHLDAHNRTEVLQQVRTIQEGYGTTMLLATNELAIGLQVADRLAVLHGRTVAQAGTHAELLAAPVSLDVADLVSAAPMARLSGRVVPSRPGVRTRVRTAAGDIASWQPDLARHGGPVLVAVAPADLDLDAGRDPDGSTGLVGTVRRVATTGSRRLLTVGTDAGDLQVEAPPPVPDAGSTVRLGVRRAVVADLDGRVVAILERP